MQRLVRHYINAQWYEVCHGFYTRDHLHLADTI